MLSVNIHRGEGEEPGCWQTAAQRCRKVEWKRKLERREGLRGGLTFPQGSFRG